MNDKKIPPFPIPGIGGAGPQQVQVDVSEAKPIICLGCQCVFFDKVFRMGLISQFAPGNKLGKDIPVEYPAYLCRDCGLEIRKELKEKH